MKSRVGSRGFWIAVGTLGLLVLACGAVCFPGLKQRRDMAAVREYIGRLQPRLSADARFKDVRLLGYSCDYVMHPYIPVIGTVPTQQDWEALESFVRASKPPVFISVRNVDIGTNQEPPKLQ